MPRRPPIRPPAVPIAHRAAGEPREPAGPIRSRLRAVAVLALLAGLVAALAACGSAPDRDPLLREPALLIEADALTRFLDRTSTLSGTPAGRASTTLLGRFAKCSAVAGHFEASDSTGPAEEASDAALLDRLGCVDDSRLAPDLAALLERERGGHAGILQWPVGQTGRLALRVDVDARGGLDLEGLLEPAEDMGTLGLLVPASEPPAPPALAPGSSLLHVQLRPAAGTGLARFVPKGGQADRLFALKGRLLEGALLEGTLELALHPPAAGGRVPLATLALHHRAAAPVEAALAEALGQLERTWTISPTPRRFVSRDGTAREGGCYVDLPLLPELAPCWVVTDAALLIGYRAEAIEAALAGPESPRVPAAAPAPPAVSAAPGRADDSPAPSAEDADVPATRLVVDFERVREIDRVLVGSDSSTRLADLYSRLELRAQADSHGAITIAGALRARP